MPTVVLYNIDQPYAFCQSIPICAQGVENLILTFLEIKLEGERQLFHAVIPFPVIANVIAESNNEFNRHRPQL